MGLIQKYNPISGNFDYVHSEDSFDDITIVANYSALPAVATVTGKFYWASASQGTSWLPGSLGGTYYSRGMYYSNGTTWEFLDVPYQATQAEVNTGTNTDKFVTPATLRGNFGTTTGTIAAGDDSRFNKNKTVTINTTTASHTGNTNETILRVLTIPANTFAANDYLMLKVMGNGLGTAGTKSIKAYINSAQTLTGSEVIISTATTSSTAVGIGFGKDYAVESTSLFKDNVSGTQNILSDYTNNTTYTTFATDFTITQYIIITGILTNSADTVLFQAAKIERKRV